MTQLASHKGKSCTLIHPSLAFLLLGFRLKERIFFFWHAPSWVSAVIFAGPASTPLEHISFCWRLGRPPRHRYGWGGRSRQWPLYQGGTSQRVTRHNFGGEIIVLAFCSMELFSFQKQSSQTKWFFLLLRFIDTGSCLKQAHTERFSS